MYDNNEPNWAWKIKHNTGDQNSEHGIQNSQGFSCHVLQTVMYHA